MVLITDRRRYDSTDSFIGTALKVSDAHGQNVGSFDAIVSDTNSEPKRFGAVDVKYTAAHRDLQSLRPGFDFLQRERHLQHS